MNKNELITLQSLPLEIKIAKSLRRIQEFIDYYGENGVYISFSGGKDSTVLLDLVRKVNKNIEAVFVINPVQPETFKFIKTIDNLTILKPEMTFEEVVKKYGYPFISKEQANYLHDIRYSTNYMRERRLNGDENGRFKLSNKYKYLINSPYPISHKCCEVMKKKPIKKYEKLTGKVPFIGTLAEESALRTQSYLKTGCNSFNSKRPNSTPLGFWTEQDILEYIYKYNLPINEAYGKVVIEDGRYKTTKCSRTGCIACGFGVHLEKNPNRFERMKEEYPKQYDYYFNKLGYKEICDYIGIKY